MNSDWSVELGPEDEALEFPWSSPDGSQRYVDLSQHPEALVEIPEAAQHPELAKFLIAIAQPQSQWLTAKCDVWIDDESVEAEAVYSAKLKLCSYVDLVARDEAARFSFERHEHWVKFAARALSGDHELPVACEFIVRRCWYHTKASSLRPGDDAATPCDGNHVPGFYATLYLFGYGGDDHEARERWAEGLRRVTGVLTALAP
jgi:hypothetical protein